MHQCTASVQADSRTVSNRCEKKPLLTVPVCIDLFLSLQSHIIHWPQHATLRRADQKLKLSQQSKLGEQKKNPKY